MQKLQGSRFDVSGSHDCLDVSAHVKIAFDIHAQWIAGGDEVFQDDIDHVLVEDLNVAERVYIKLQALQFDATLVWNVLDSDRGEIRKIGERADRGEFGNLEVDLDLVAGKLVRKRIERKELHLRARRRLNVETLLVRHQAGILTDQEASLKQNHWSYII